MRAERKTILQMLQQGQINTDEAMQLLRALDTGEVAAETAVNADPTCDDTTASANPVLACDVISPTGMPPDMDRLRRFWQIPFFAALAFFLATALGLRAMYQASDGAIGFWFVCVWSLFLCTFLLTALAFMSRRAPWLHVRVQERGGRRIAISLPLPLRLATWGVTTAQGFADEEAQGKLDMAASFLTAARLNWQQPDSEPVMIDVHDDDGDQVQVYIG